MLIKSALRDLLSVPYGMISILVIGSLRSPPPIRLRRTSPYAGGRINRSMLSCRDMAPWLSIHSPTTKWGEGGGASHQRGIAFPRPSGRLYGFIQTGAFYNLEAPYHNPRAKGASNLSPLRTFGPKGRQPSSPIGACPSYKKTGTFRVGFLIASLIVLISERKAARWQCRGRSRGGRFPGP